jgi:hypothetical protein
VGVLTGSVTLPVPPEGISGKYGVPIMCSYQYKADSIKGVLVDADTDASDADENVDTFSVYGGEIDDLTADSDTSQGNVDDICTDIDGEADDTKEQVVDARAVPDQIQNDIDALSLYLDTMLSGDCKANIVRISCLELDANGFYVAPALGLKNDLKAYLDERKIVTVQNSVVGGEFYLVKVKLEVKIKLEPLFVFQAIQPLVASALDTILKGRDYKQPLLRSEYYGAVDAVDGVDYSNNTISEVAYADSDNTGTPPIVDSDGNLYVGEYEVITKWDVTITEIQE